MSEISVISRFGGSEAPPQSPSKKMTKNENFEKNSCEKKRQRGKTLRKKKKDRGAKPYARKKRQGGKILMPEISVLSGFGGSKAPPQSPSKKMTKNKIFEKNHARKKKARGQTIPGGGIINPATSVKDSLGNSF